jgi:hypothetical protein
MVNLSRQLRRVEKLYCSLLGRPFQLYAPGHFYDPLVKLEEILPRKKAIFDRSKPSVAAIDINERQQVDRLAQFGALKEKLSFPEFRTTCYS